MKLGSGWYREINGDNKGMGNEETKPQLTIEAWGAMREEYERRPQRREDKTESRERRWSPPGSEGVCGRNTRLYWGEEA
jgi:hypothetical protein